VIKTQEQFLQEALEFKKQNPEMDIHICVDSDEILEDSTWTAHRIGKVEISPWFEDGDQIIMDEDQIKEHLEDFLCDEYKNDAELEKAVDEKYKAEVKKAICIYTYAG
jgi:hypothetical protein